MLTDLDAPREPHRRRRPGDRRGSRARRRVGRPARSRCRRWWPSGAALPARCGLAAEGARPRPALRSGEVALPGLGTVIGLEARADEPLLHLGWTSFTDTAGGSRLRRRRAACCAPRFAAGARHRPRHRADLVPSADGTPVPVFLVHRPDVTADERAASGLALRLRRFPHRDHAGRSSRPASRSRRPAACRSRSPACAAAASTARRGTTPGGSRTSRTCSTTRSPSPQT